MASTSSSNKISPKKRTYPPPEPLPYAQTSLKKKGLLHQLNHFLLP